jgi:hypothetical protein
LSDDRRNPYLVLGVPYGTDRAIATRSFAQRSRRARRDDAFPYSVEDLTWALHQVEANLDDPTVAIDHFRVPADPSQLQLPEGPGLLRPAATPLERRTEPSTPSSLEALRQQAVQEVTAGLIDLAATNGRAAFIPAKPAKPANPQPSGNVRRRRHIWPWILLGVLLAAGIAAAAAVLLIANGDEKQASADANSGPSTTLAEMPPPTTQSEVPPPTAQSEPPTTDVRDDVDAAVSILAEWCYSGCSATNPDGPEGWPLYANQYSDTDFGSGLIWLASVTDSERSSFCDQFWDTEDELFITQFSGYFELSQAYAITDIAWRLCDS